MGSLLGILPQPVFILRQALNVEITEKALRCSHQVTFKMEVFLVLSTKLFGQKSFQNQKRT